MKKWIACFASLLSTFLVHAQNVGVNTTNPQASLDVRGSERVGGNTNFTQFDSTTGRIIWTGAALYAPTSQQIIRHSASGEGMYAGGGRLEYRNTTVPVFFTDWTTGNGYFKNRLGINNLTPQFPLSMDGSLGDKISLWTDGTPTHYGFGIQSSLLQIFSKTSLDDIAFGYGSSTAFTERMRIKGNGNVGIGNINPGYWLDVNGRMRVRSGGNSATSAGIWLNNNSNFETAFIGMEDDTHVGFYGNTGAFWKFAMNTQTGAIQLNGSDGTAGQVMQSNGSSSATTWASSTNTLYNNTVSVSNTATQVLFTALGFVPLTGMTYSFSASGNVKVLASYNIAVQPESCFGCGYSNTYIDLVVDGGTANRQFTQVANGTAVNVSLTKVLTLASGSHTISISGSAIGGNVDFGLCCAFEKLMTIQVIPQ